MTIWESVIYQYQREVLYTPCNDGEAVSKCSALNGCIRAANSGGDDLHENLARTRSLKGYVLDDERRVMTFENSGLVGLWWCCHFSYRRSAFIPCKIDRSLKLRDKELILEIVDTGDCYD